jgi:hypothetical protein
MSFAFEMRLADGTPADPPTFVSAIPNWRVGGPSSAPDCQGTFADAGPGEFRLAYAPIRQAPQLPEVLSC